MMNRHRPQLKRLSQVWLRDEVYFITTCVAERRRLLDCAAALTILRDEFEQARERHGWVVGAYLLMPDHLHFFCAPGTQPRRNLSGFVGSVKQWSAKRLAAELHIEPPVWQQGFFDHLLRSEESYAEKVHYVRENPVRAGLVASTSEWPWQGEIEVFLR